ncbi:hypothetical protein QUB63_24895 [Microcoleus sp. ARI1-B5]|uniref:hypothetical protein n=1 Tax=unclassified Microcoleus TaxID=2642155 RepID=UPI002FCEB25F
MGNYQLSAISYQRLAEALVFPHCTMVLTSIHFSLLGCLRSHLVRADRTLFVNRSDRK